MENTQTLPRLTGRALDTKMHLDLLVYTGKLDESHLKRKVLEFGAGWGTNTLALNNFGGAVEAVDVSGAVNEIVTRGILPQDRVYHQDGIQLLRDRPNTYDLVASFLFGPISSPQDEKFLREFYEAASVGIKQDGRILLTSDISSFSYIERLAQEGYGVVSKNPTFPHAFIGRKA
ncbi:MAG: class I SAM-dependent methyltransferase [Nanoarchaeota archaeon]|mgnify:CR=1 FL=1